MDKKKKKSSGMKRTIANDESENVDDIQIFETVGLSKTPTAKASIKGLSIDIPATPKFEEGSEDNPEYGLPDVSDEVNMLTIKSIKSLGPRTTKHSKNKSGKVTKDRRSAFFGAPADGGSNISSSEASLPKISPVNILAEISEQREQN